MAQVLPDNKNFAQTERAFLKQSLQDYSSYLNSLPLLVTFYSKDHSNSTHDENLGTVQQIFGADSPIKFNKIYEYPLYKCSALEGISEDSEDVGTEGQIEGTAVIPPQQVMPRVDDLFQIRIYGKESIFRISSVKRSNIKGRTFWEVSFYLYGTMGDLGSIDRQVFKEYKVVGSPSSVTKSAIIEVNKADICSRIMQKTEEFINILTGFYISDSEAYIYKIYPDTWRWDECVHAFITRNKIFERATPYRNEVVLRHMDIFLDPYFYDQYNNSIYGALESGDYSRLDENFEGASNWTTYTEELPCRFLKNIKVRGSVFNNGKANNINYFPVFGNLKEYLDDTSGVIEPSAKISENYLKFIKYFSNNPDLNEIDTYLNTIVPGRGYSDYYLLPTAIFILKNIVERIKTIYNFNN